MSLLQPHEVLWVFNKEVRGEFCPVQSCKLPSASLDLQGSFMQEHSADRVMTCCCLRYRLDIILSLDVKHISSAYIPWQQTSHLTPTKGRGVRRRRSRLGKVVPCGLQEKNYILWKRNYNFWWTISVCYNLPSILQIS